MDIQQSEGMGKYNEIFRAGVAGDYLFKIDLMPMEDGDGIRVCSSSKAYDLKSRMFSPITLEFTLDAGEKIHLRRLSGTPKAWHWTVTLIHAITKPKHQVISPEPLHVWPRYK